MITILAVGKKHEVWIQSGLERYTARLKRPYDIKWTLLSHSAHFGELARTEESNALLTRTRDTDFVLLLDETGHNYSSTKISEQFEYLFSHSKHIVIIIGGAYGVSSELKARADVVWSLSKLVFPHQLVRLILVEQIYRAESIAAGLPYHHE